MELIIRTFNLKLKYPFTISRETRTVQPTLIVELCKDGISGFGEATSNIYYNVTSNSIQASLKIIEPYLERLSAKTPEEFWREAFKLLQHDRFALCALDEAFNDWFAKKKNKKLYELWGYNTHKNPMTNYTIGIDTIEKMVAKMKERPWPIYKIKMGTKEDVKIVSELRKHTEAIFRIDVNAAWTVAETLQNARALIELGVEFIEQPLPADHWDGHKELFEKSCLPIIADESCIVEEDVKRCFNHFHGINIKLLKCGGLTPARRMIAMSKLLGLKTMVGCMTESTVGISAVAHLLPELDYVDMDGALLLREDIASGVIIKNGIIYYSEQQGTGAQLLK